jgi:beta-glucanase (GH16 family)
VVTTARSFSQRYGYFEMRARMPEGKGLWPAFWLLPADGSWPPEIDVVEMLGHEPDTYYATVHYAEKGAHKESGAGIKRLKLTTQHVTFGLLWTADELVWYQDDVEVRRAKNPGIDKPMYMLVNLAVGGKWPGAPDKTTRFPAQMRVDYVRAFALKPPPKASGDAAQPTGGR